MVGRFFANRLVPDTFPAPKETSFFFTNTPTFNPVRSVAHKPAESGRAKRVRIRRTAYKRKHEYA